MEAQVQPRDSYPASGEGPVRERELDVLRQLSGNAGEFRDRIDEYVTMSGQLLAAMQESLDKKDAQALALDACALKGVSAQLGAHRVSAASESVENAAKRGLLKAARGRLRGLVDVNKAAVERLLSIEASPFP